jgi:hypothetical protein
MESYREEYYRIKGKLKETGLTTEEIARKMHRASGDCVCDCGKDYYSHPYVTEARDQDGEPFLHVLCNGDIVKL